MRGFPLLASQANRGANVEGSPAGAGQDVGRSCILVSIGGKNIMLDCGMHMGYNDDVRALMFTGSDDVHRDGTRSRSRPAETLPGFFVRHAERPPDGLLGLRDHQVGDVSQWLVLPLTLTLTRPLLDLPPAISTWTTAARCPS